MKICFNLNILYYCLTRAWQKVAMTSIKKTFSDRIKERGQITLTGRGKVRQIIYWICFLSQTIRGMVILKDISFDLGLCETGILKDSFSFSK